jgi:hypothetical protein
MRQLSLFKGKRQRGIKPPPPLEFSIQVMLADMLRRWCNPAWEWTHLPLGEKRNIVTAVRLKRMGARPGWPDFIFAGPNAKIVFLELKRKGNGLSDAQEIIANHLRDCGFEYLITDNLNEAVAWLKRLGILRATIGV